MSLRSLAELVLLSLGLMALWRAEVEWHGWDGLIWISYEHWAAPFGVLVFLAWLAQTPIVRATGRRWGLLGIAFFEALVFVLATRELLFLMFNRFAFMMIEAAYAMLGCLVTAPMVAWGIGRLLGHRLPWWTLVLSVGLLVASPTLALLLLDTFSGARTDLIHTVKTGWAIPPVVFAFGLPWTVKAPTSPGPPPGSAWAASADATPSDP